MFQRRLKVFLTLMALGVAVLLVRLTDLQLLRGEAYRRRAEEKLTWVELLPTGRGRIVDRKGRVLAADQPCYEFCLPYAMLRGPGETDADRGFHRRWVARQVRGIQREEKVPRERAEALFDHRLARTWEVASEATGRPVDELRAAADRAVQRVETIRRLTRRRTGYGHVRLEHEFHAVAGGLTEDEVVALRARMDEMVGSATVRPSHRRWYPFGSEACHVIGRTGEVGREEVTAGAGEVPLRERMGDYLPGDWIGREGVEKLCEPMLRGVRGYRRGRRTGEIDEEVPAWLGQAVHLTLDMELQRRLRAALARHATHGAGALVVLNVPDDEQRHVAAGEVLAMVSLPVFDLNEYQKDFRRLEADQVNLPTWNRAVAVRYPPGSTIKPLAALAALHHKVIDENTTFHCQGYLHHPGAFRCWIWGAAGTGHSWLNVVGGLENSCNVFFYNVGEQLGVRRQVAWLGQFGFADSPGTGLPEERPGLLPDPRRSRYAGDARFMAIGQGPISVSCLHVANAMATIARRGRFVSPLLVRELAHCQQRRRIELSDRHLELVHEGMYRVINSTHGTGHRHAYVPGAELCGKTGTAETEPRRVDSDGDGRPDQVVRSGDTAWLAGFAPRSRPQIAFAIVVEYADAGGAVTCGPIGKEVIRACRELGYFHSAAP